MLFCMCIKRKRNVTSKSWITGIYELKTIYNKHQMFYKGLEIQIKKYKSKWQLDVDNRMNFEATTNINW